MYLTLFLRFGGPKIHDKSILLFGICKNSIISNNLHITIFADLVSTLRGKKQREFMEDKNIRIYHLFDYYNEHKYAYNFTSQKYLSFLYSFNFLDCAKQRLYHFYAQLL